MIFNKSIDEFVDRLIDEKGYLDIQNPWENLQNRKNLKAFLKQQKNAKYILIGEAPGRKGCLQCGVPFCDDYTLENILNIKCNKIKKSRETSAQRIYCVFNKNFISWNAFPYQPCQSGKNNINRNPSDIECQNGFEKLNEFLILFGKGKIIVLLGQKAEKSYNLFLKNHKEFQNKKTIVLIHPSAKADKYREKRGLEGWKEYIKKEIPDLKF